MREDHPPFTRPGTQVQATDRTDNDEITYGIVGERVNRALQSGASNYFQIDDKTGQIYLTQTVLNTNITDFLLTLQACDNGIPARCVNADIRIIIIRDSFPPKFVYNTATGLFSNR
ncbi:hypothetical protein DPMN_025808 [Dreissena polymorpha]|uniref:Cadherin domain-containing protein n=1 Tax=Dreissena polymorpha TaxID=45954 RepID=A0A9D4LS66_DREPO|nr:hypothetical protein DPMN_025808 [Dreissena polymorpha]